jgi:hypothetical protein
MNIDALGPILGSQIIAPVLALDFPSTKKLTVIQALHLPREVKKDYFGSEEEQPARLAIHGQVEGGVVWTINIDAEENVFTRVTWDLISGTSGYGSAEIGIALLGLPALILTSPLLLLAHGIYGLGRVATGIDRHSFSLYHRLAPQLSPEDAEALYRAFHNHHNGVEEAYVRKVQAQYDAKRRLAKLAQRFDSWKDDYIDGPFMDRLDHGCAEPEEVLKDLDDWKKRQSVDRSVEVWTWLGMTKDEYVAWRDQKKTVLQLLEERGTPSALREK